MSESFQTHVVEQLRRADTRATARRMFGAIGLYAGDVMFGIIAGDVVYFKADDVTRPRFAAASMDPFRPFGDDRMSVGYFTIPDGVLDEPDELREWASDAVAAARRARAAKNKPKKTAKKIVKKIAKTSTRKAAKKRR